MAAFYLASDIHEREPFTSLHPAAFWLYITAIGWTTEHQKRGVVSLNVFKHIQRRRWRQGIAELLEAGLLEELNDGWYRLARDYEGQTIWRTTNPKDPRPHIPTRIRRAVYERDGFACVACRSVDSISLDHIYPYSLGGPDTVDNLQTLCKPCNSSKGARV